MKYERFLREVFDRYHRPEYIDPDPLSRVLLYPEPEDREIAALVCASLALGRVGGILKACDEVLSRLGERPREALLGMTPADLREGLCAFRYRFFGSGEICSLLEAVRGTIGEFGSLEAAFLSGGEDPHAGVMPALETFTGILRRHAPGPLGILLPDPKRGSASKRLHLFLRWMVRKDAVDPGGWSGVSPAGLVVPLDTHIHALSRALGITVRSPADIRTAMEVTAAFRLVDPEDPVKFDFSLSRLGIHPEAKLPANFSRISLDSLS